MCRAACHGGAAGCGTNLAMVSIIKSQFGPQYEERQKEVFAHNIYYEPHDNTVYIYSTAAQQAVSYHIYA